MAEGWLKECSLMGEFNEVHLVPMRELMQNRVFKRFVGKLLREADEVARQVIRMDLSEGTGKAVKLQGRYEGMLRVLSAFEDVLDMEAEDARDTGEYWDRGHDGDDGA